MILDQKILNVLIQNIDILKFSLAFLGVIFVTLLLWELGLFGGQARKPSVVPLVLIAQSEVADTAYIQKNETKEDFDPFKQLIGQGDDGAQSVKVMESPTLSGMMEDKIETADIKEPEEFRMEDYLEGYEKTTNGLAKFEEKSKTQTQAFISINPPGEKADEGTYLSEDKKENPQGVASQPEASQPEASQPEASQPEVDPWQNMISKSLEESKAARKKSIKIDLEEENK